MLDNVYQCHKCKRFGAPEEYDIGARYCIECTRKGDNIECNCFTGKQQHKHAHDLWCVRISKKREEELEKLAEMCFRNYRLYKEELEILNRKARERGYC